MASTSSTLMSVSDYVDHVRPVTNNQGQLEPLYYVGLMVSFADQKGRQVGQALMQVARRHYICPQLSVGNNPCSTTLIIQTIEVQDSDRRKGHATKFITFLQDQGFCLRLQAVITKEGERLATSLVKHKGWKKDKYSNNYGYCPQSLV